MEGADVNANGLVPTRPILENNPMQSTEAAGSA
jgi:hypothetical protein